MAVPTLPRYVYLGGGRSKVEGPKLGAAGAWASGSNLLGKLPMHATADCREERGPARGSRDVKLGLLLGWVRNDH
jgi:hypothetical protein